MTAEKLHRDRDRAESFGAVAEQYDRHRPSPPEALVDDLVALGPERVLDVGCGTGKAGAALAARGLSVLGVEPDVRMAQVARGYGIEVDVDSFEDWDAAGRRFDLLLFADSWHWIDPAAGLPKAAELLEGNGTIARLWNGYTVDESVIDAFDAVYRRHAPEIVQVWRPRHAETGRNDDFTAGGFFDSLERRSYRWQRVVTAAEWVSVVETVSDHQRLGRQRLTLLLRELREAIERLGGSIQSHHETHLVLARRAR